MILVILGSYCFTAPDKTWAEPSLQSPARSSRPGRTSTTLRWNSVLMDIPAIRLFPSATVNMETNMVLRVSENVFFLHPNSYVHDLSYTSKKLQIETHFMEHIWIWLSTDFWGSLFSEQPTQFCECKKDQASSKTKGDWALISPEMVESTSFKVGTICQHLLQVSQKNKLCVLFFLVEPRDL